MSYNKGYVQDLVQSIPYKEECPTVTSLPDDTEIYTYQEKVENLLTELTASQLLKSSSTLLKKTTRKYDKHWGTSKP